jgi:sn-glycerol 3-phosphate transport system ATP-binding protein
MSVYQNMAYGLKNRGMPKDEIQSKVEKAAKTLEISHLLDNKPKQLSGGQRQRVAMGRAIVRSPKVFLFDEPLSNLDAKLRVQMRIEIKRLQQEFATTAIYVTHDQVEAMTLADRLVVMNGGKVEQLGPPIELYDKPQTQFVASFLGSPAMNFLPAELKQRQLTLPGGIAFRLPDEVKLVDQPPQAINLGIRPEHLEACSEAEADATLNIEMLEPLGADTLVYGTLNNDPTLIISEQSGKMKLNRGDRLPVRFDRDALHLFDQATEKRISL